MRGIFFLFLILSTFIGCKPSKTIIILSDEIKESVIYLSSDDLAGRNTGTGGIEKAAKYIEQQLKSFGVKPYFESYRDDFKAKGLDAFNIVGYIEGTDSKLKNEFVIISAHYDHIGYAKAVDNDSIANGANDNASGTSSVLAIAKYFAAKKKNKRSIMFVLFSAEELGLLGSEHLAKRLKNENLDLYSMLNFEMTGVPLKDRDYVAFLSGYDLSNMASKINEYVDSNLIGLSDIAKKYNLFVASDNYAFYKEFGLPCQSLSSCDLSNYDYYHHVDDEADKLDYDFMASLINKIIPAIEKMCDTPTKEIEMYE
ncbi:M28 family peptidase [Flavobacteriaceae bacterium MJ-SS4]|uniref:M28 family metallopeptidase n=1 Tax=Gilvirhabdus luticola TaxID=3079858 RepID=UPI0032DDA559